MDIDHLAGFDPMHPPLVEAIAAGPGAGFVPDDQVFSGTLNLWGLVQVKVDRLFDARARSPMLPPQPILEPSGDEDCQIDC